MNPKLNTTQQERPRERLLAHGPSPLTDAELLAILLRIGSEGLPVTELAKQILQQTQGLRGATMWQWRQWTSIHGIGPAKATTLMAAFELGRRAWFESKQKTVIAKPEQAYAYIAPRFLGQLQEQLWVIGLDAKNQLVVEQLIGVGSLNTVMSTPRDLFAPLVRSQVVKAMVVHNHPSGDPTPSVADLEFTKKIVVCGHLLGIDIVDHLIIGDQCYVSLDQQGML